jgi:bifunctional N-acetylglucosamine-1-phosphate-uridyltransferase/glucosamine-1-phosphate-acetyltransferase GlmU-like protein
VSAIATTLVVLAAGRGTRFGGPKQLAAVREDGSAITDILLGRAADSGVGRAVIVVNEDIERRVRDHLDARDPGVHIEIVVQVRPRGTADAVLAARDVVAGPIVVANADDLYPASAFAALAGHLRGAPAHEHAAVGFRLDRTRVGARPESRALLDVDETGILRGIREAQVRSDGGGRFSTPESSDAVAGDQLVSMNIWAFRAGVFGALEGAVAEHDRRGLAGEVFLPDVVASMIAAGATVRVLPSVETCLSLTYAEDLDAVRSASS